MAWHWLRALVYWWWSCVSVSCRAHTLGSDIGVNAEVNNNELDGLPSMLSKNRHHLSTIQHLLTKLTQCQLLIRRPVCCRFAKCYLVLLWLSAWVGQTVCHQLSLISIDAVPFNVPMMSQSVRSLIYISDTLSYNKLCWCGKEWLLMYVLCAVMMFLLMYCMHCVIFMYYIWHDEIYVTGNCNIHCVSKKCTNFETV